MKRDYYDVLGVERAAGEDEIKKSFRRLARQLHPDANPDDPEAEERFKELAEAYEVLSDDGRRGLYDQYGHDGLKSGGYRPGTGDFGSFGDLFSAFFGGGGFGGGRSRGPAQGEDVAVRVDIDLADAARGISVDVEFDAVDRCDTCNGNGAKPGTPIRTCERCQGSGQIQSVSRTPFGQMVRAAVCDACGGDGRIPETPCATCDGRGQLVDRRKLSVDVPAGIDDGQRIRLTGRGHAGDRGAPAGDLYVVVRVKPDPRFIRDGGDLITVVDVAAPLAALGTTLAVPAIDGEIDVEIPAGTQPGEIITLSGRGMPPLQRGRRGDLRVVVNVIIPRRLSKEQKRLLEQLAGTLKEGQLTHPDEGMIGKLKRLLAT